MASQRALLVVVLWGAGCTGNLAYRCSVDGDCQRPQACVANTCQDPVSTETPDGAVVAVDGSVVQDASAAVDGSTVDASTVADAATGVDASPVADASTVVDGGAVVDAAVPDAAVADGGAAGDGGAQDAAALSDAAVSDAALPNPDGGCGAQWWDCAWTERVRLSFDNGAQEEALVDFPVLVHLTAQRVDFAKIKAAGEDLRFIAADHVTVLKHEIERITPTEAWIWVRVPLIGAFSTTDHMWMYFGNTAAMANADVAGTWGAGDWRAVWHMQDGNASTPGLGDATTNMQTADALVGTGGKFDGASGHSVFEVAQDGALGTLTGFTVGAWVQSRDLSTTWRGIFSARALSSTDDFSGGNFVLHTTDDKFGFQSDPLASNQFLAPVDTPKDWHFVAAVVPSNGGRVTLYLDGRVVGQTASGQSLAFATAGSLRVGSRFFGNMERAYFKGLIDEVRVAGVARSAAWLRAEYLSTSDAFIHWPKQAWWDANWRHRVWVGLLGTAIRENLEGFQALVALGPSSVDWNVMTPNGADLRFVDDDGTPLPHEVAQWVPGTAAQVWVRVPQLNAYSRRDGFWLYYGNAVAPDMQAATLVWPAPCLGAYHLERDGTRVSAAGTNGVATDSFTAGRVGSAWDSNASSTLLTIGDSGALDDMSEDFFVSAWAKRQSVQNSWLCVVCRQFQETDENAFYLGFLDEKYEAVTFIGNAHRAIPNAIPAAAVGTWVRLAAVYNGRRLWMVADETVVGTTDASGSQVNLNKPVTVGSDVNASGFTDAFDGVIDEVRFGSGARSTERLAAEHANETGTLFLLESPEVHP